VSLLVTGGAGFIGSHFVERRRRLHPNDRVVVLDALTYAGRRESVPEGAVLVEGDVCDAALVARVLAEHEVDRVVHLAAESHVDRSIFGPVVFTRTNVLGTATLLEAARVAKVRRFVHVSTDEVYGELGPHDPPFVEASPLGPRSPYAASKAGAELALHAYAKTYRFPTIVTRGSNTYGPRQLPEKLVPRMIFRAIEGKRLPLYGDGLQVRDWLHVDDHAAAIDLVLEAGRDFETYNVGGRDERTNLAVVEAILAALERPHALIEHVRDRPGHDRRYALDDTKIERELGFTRTRAFAEGLRATTAFYLENEGFRRAAARAELGSEGFDAS